MITFTESQRKAISRRLIRIPEENAAFNTAISETNTAIGQYTEVDDLNKLFFDFYNDTSSCYESEYQNLSGAISGTFSESDIINSINGVPGNLFFPVTPPDPWVFLIPKPVDEVNGVQVGSTSFNEQSIINYIDETLDVLKNGLLNGVPAATLSGLPYTAGDLTITVISESGFDIGEKCIIYDGTNFMIFTVDSTGPGVLNITEVVPPRGIIASGSAVRDSVGGYNNSAREAMIAGGLLDVLTSNLDLFVADWGTTLDSQASNLQANGEENATKILQNTAALAKVDTARDSINDWQALPYSGVTGRYSDISLSIIETEYATRLSNIPTRVSEITGSLGGVINNGDGTFASVGSSDDVYYVRFQWLDRRINRMHGSGQRIVSSQSAIVNLNTFISNNTSLYNAYSAYFVSTLFALGADGSNKVTVDNASLFTAGDTIMVISEGQPEISGVVMEINDSTITASFDVSESFTTEDVSRMYREV